MEGKLGAGFVTAGEATFSLAAAKGVADSLVRACSFCSAILRSSDTCVRASADQQGMSPMLTTTSKLDCS